MEHNETYERMGEIDNLLFSCHSHEQAARASSTPSLTMLFPLFFGGLGSNVALIYALRKYSHIIEHVLQQYCYSLAALDLMKVFLVVLPAMVRLCGKHAFSSTSCYSGYWINMFLLQASLLLLALAAYDRVMVLRKSEDYGRDRNRWKHVFLFAVLIPLSYVTFDVVYTKLYEANASIGHSSERNSLCYDQKLGWCTTKTAPHEHENTGGASDLSGSRKGGVFICQAHIMTVLMLIALVTMQSGHANYKKMYNDISKEGCYYLMILTLNVWLYLPAMFVILMDTFTASVFPTDYYEKFYVYLYITPLMPAVMNSIPLFIAYRDYIFNDEQEPPKHYQSLSSEQHKITSDHEGGSDLERICRRMSRLELSRLEFPPRSPLPEDRTRGGGGSEDKDYFDKIGSSKGQDEIALMLMNMGESDESLESMTDNVIANPVQQQSHV